MEEEPIPPPPIPAPPALGSGGGAMLNFAFRSSICCSCARSASALIGADVPPELKAAAPMLVPPAAPPTSSTRFGEVGKKPTWPTDGGCERSA